MEKRSQVKIKICGLTDIDNLCRILFLEPDYVGFIFYPKSPRYVVGKIKPDMLSIIPSRVHRVGVFVNSTETEIRQTAATYGLQTIQLHGNEKPELCHTLRESGFEVIKAFSIEDEHDFDHIWSYEDYVDYYLFDTKTPNFGGSGKEFDWQLILRQPLRKPWFLSGGISIDNINVAAQSGAYAIDLNSRFELAPGIKDYELLHKALAKIKKSQ
ncbi:MAG: phosphoribosylanthranilate isomerase [Marinilabiliaceae bacterium]|nr:phosphoribosylanthranilate isomerase [Marinilabiliaceae bacterium]